MIRLERLRPGTVHRLLEIGRTPDPAPYVEEVESFLFGRGAADERNLVMRCISTEVSGDAGVTDGRGYVAFLVDR